MFKTDISFHFQYIFTDTQEFRWRTFWLLAADSCHLHEHTGDSGSSKKKTVRSSNSTGKKRSCPRDSFSKKMILNQMVEGEAEKAVTLSRD